MGVSKLGSTINKRREELGVSKQHVADECGCSRDTIERFLSGQTQSVNSGVLDSMLDLLGLEIQPKRNFKPPQA
jgi:transcriptional regulator with XRE-family HTH domain